MLESRLNRAHCFRHESVSVLVYNGLEKNVLVLKLFRLLNLVCLVRTFASFSHPGFFLVLENGSGEAAGDEVGINHDQDGCEKDTVERRSTTSPFPILIGWPTFRMRLCTTFRDSGKPSFRKRAREKLNCGHSTRVENSSNICLFQTPLESPPPSSIRKLCGLLFPFMPLSFCVESFCLFFTSQFAIPSL